MNAKNLSEIWPPNLNLWIQGKTSAFIFYISLFYIVHTLFSLSFHSSPRHLPAFLWCCARIWVAAYVCVCARTYRCVFVRWVAAYSLMYLYFSRSLQASLLLHQSSIFQIKWSWLKDCANVWFLKCVCVSTGTLRAISDLHYFFMSFDYGHS